MHRKILTYSTQAKAEIRTITGDLRRCVAESGVRDGCLLAYSLHTTLGLIVQETAETHLCEDVLDYLAFVIEDDGDLYRHRGHLHPRSNGDDTDRNAPSHLRQILVNQNVLLDVHDGNLSLGPWQDVAIAEFDGPRPTRHILVKVWEDCGITGSSPRRHGDTEKQTERERGRAAERNSDLPADLSCLSISAIFPSLSVSPCLRGEDPVIPQDAIRTPERPA